MENRESKLDPAALAKQLLDHPYGWQDENGVDITLIHAALRLTPDERVRQAQSAAQKLVRMLDARISKL